MKWILFLLAAVITASGQSGLRSPAFVSNLRPESGFTVQAVTFDGATDYLNRGADLDGNTDTKVGIVSFWFKTATGGSVIGTEQQFFTVVVGGTLLVEGLQADTSSSVHLVASTDYRDDNWHHMMASWDGAANAKHLYVDGVDALNGAISTVANANTEYTRPDWTIASRGDAFGKYTGCLTEVYVNTAQYLDLSNASNRLKFYNAGVPVGLGPTGNTPTGTSAILYVHTWSGNYNSGTGGALTLNGVLGACTAP